MVHKENRLKILLVYPQYPDTFWSFKHALKFISKKAAFPPLGLLTVAAMLPREWEKKLVDMNVENLNNRDIEWADYVFLSAMAVQRDSAKDVIKRCNQCGTRIVAGGPLFTTEYEVFNGIDHFILNEAEISLPPFIEDLKKGCAKPVYTADRWPDIETAPIPDWDLINMKKYVSMSVQYSRGCPFDCEFCDIVVLNGHKPRVKSRAQILSEFDALYNRGWRGNIFIVDDNFIGNKRKLKEEILPATIEWMKLKRYPFAFFTEASINLSDDEELMRLMADANFNMVFVGIETPNEESLGECKKAQNMNRDLLASVKKLQNRGLQVQGGFIVGFDSDPNNIFESQINFIQKSGIVTAMVGILSALPGTKLHQRLKMENRLLGEVSGNNTDCSLNFIPKMNHEVLVEGYRGIVSNIYSPKHYYKRIKTFLAEYEPRHVNTNRPQLIHIRAFIRSMWVLGLKEKGRSNYWRFIAWVMIKQPRQLPISVNLAICGFHFRKVLESYNVH